MPSGPSSTPRMRRKPLQARSQERVRRILDVAEDLFATQGYSATTTRAIAKQAQIPVGTLYQFFPDKGAILQALAVHHNELLHQQLALLNHAELAYLPLSVYVEKLIDISVQFFWEHPGYYATFMEVQGSIPELQKIEDAADAQLIQEFAMSLAQRETIVDAVDYEAIAFVLVKAIGTLLWLSLSREQTFQRRVVAEMKCFALSYLQSYFPSNSNTS